MIKVTEKAAKNIRRIIQNHKGIFFGIKGGGCHGFEYILKPTNEINGENVTTLTAVEDIPFVICEKSILFTFGTTIDWQDDVMGSRFVFNNPNSDSTCGCGNTFSIKK